MKKHTIKETIAHGLHLAHKTETGKRAIEAVGHGALAAGAAVVAPIVGTAAAPVVATAAIGYGLWRLLKD